MTFTVYDPDNKPTVDLILPKFAADLGASPVSISLTGSVSFANADKAHLADIIRIFSSPDGLKDFSVDARSHVPINAFGIQWYPGLYLHKMLEIGDVSSNLTSLLVPNENAKPLSLPFLSNLVLTCFLLCSFYIL